MKENKSRSKFYKLIINFLLAVGEKLVINEVLGKEGDCLLFNFSFLKLPCNIATWIVWFLYVLITIGVIEFICWIFPKIRNKWEKHFHAEKCADFQPRIYWDKKKSLVCSTVCLHKNSLFPLKISASIKYTRSKDIPKAENYENKEDFFSDQIQFALRNLWLQEPIIWKDKSFSKRLNRKSEEILNIFAIDVTNDIFYLSQKNGKPSKFWNNSRMLQLNEMSFEFGEYNFILVISGVNLLKRKFVQNIPFVLNFSKEGILIKY